MKSVQKVVAIVGPTASGKSTWAIKLAHLFNGAVLSADSRQVYKGLDAATGKVSEDEMGGIPHYLLDIVDVSREFSLADYQKRAYQVLDSLGKRQPKVLPIMAGGTGLYVAAVCDGYELVDVPPNPELRAQLEKLTLEKLQEKLHKLDPDNDVDIKNPVRLIRAIEILSRGQKVSRVRNPRYDVLKIGIAADTADVESGSEKRIKNMDWDKLFAESRALSKLKRNEAHPLSLYYRPVAKYLAGEINKNQLIEEMIRADTQYAKRQMTWFKKDKSIVWVKSFAEARKLVEEFVR